MSVLMQIFLSENIIDLFKGMDLREIFPEDGRSRERESSPRAATWIAVASGKVVHQMFLKIHA